MSKKSFLVSLILIITVGLTTLAVGWHKYIDASKNPKLISCGNHVDSNYDMACDFCGQILPLSNYVEKKEVAIFSEDESLIKVNGMMPKDTLVSSKVIEKDEAFSLAKEHLKDLKEEDVLFAYDISLDSKDFEYQPENFGQTVTVNISKLNLNIKDNVALLHIIDDNNYEILPVSSFTNEEIKFRASRFSTYILISVESHTVKFSGDGDFKITEVSGDEITNNSQVASGTNFAFSIVPGEGYGITGVTLKTSSGNIIYPSGDSGDNFFVVVGEELGRTCNISSVTEDIDVNVETALIPKITTNIITAKVKLGEAAEFTISADNATTFTWQYRENENDYWHEMSSSIGTSKVSGDTATFTTTAATNLLSGYDFRCIVGNDVFKDHHGAVSNIAKLIVEQDDINSGKGAITPAPDVPENFVATSGDYADAIEVTWKMVSGLKYRLSYINENSEKVLLSADVTSPYMHIGIEKNKAYEYVIEAYDSNMRYSEPSSTRGSTQYDDIYDVVNKDTIKPVIDNINITPKLEKVGPLTDVTITFNVTDDNYDYNDVCKLFKEDIEVLINGTISTSVNKELTRAVIPSGERYTLKLNNLIGDGNLSVRIPTGKIFDLAKNGNDEYLISTNIIVVRTEVATVKNFTATSGDYIDSIKITWKDTENTNVKYVLEASNKDNNWIVLSDNATSPHMHTGLTKNMSFEYRIKAVAENGDESEYVYTIGRTEYDPLFGDVMIDTVKPTIDLKSKNPELDYLGESQQVTFTFESFDTNYNSATTTLTKDSFVIKVDGNVIDGVVRTLTKEDITSGERFTLTVTNVTGNGPLTIMVPAGVITDCALNQNEEKDIATGITVMNDATTTDTAPTLVPGVHEIGVTTNQVCAVPIASIKYEYRLSGDGDFNTWNTTTDLSDVIKNLSSDTE